MVALSYSKDYPVTY